MERKRNIRAVALLLAVWLLSAPAMAVPADEIRLIPSGETIGIHVDSSGLLVVGIAELNTEKGPCSPGWDAGMRVGDFILAIGSQAVTTIEELRRSLADNRGEVAVRFLRDGKEMQLTVKPVYSNDGEGELGLWLRSGLSGLGTMTFLDPATGSFGALGHGVSDGDTGLLLPLKNGCVANAKVDTIQRGEKGKPGEVKGSLGLEIPFGETTHNTVCGIFGSVSGEVPEPGYGPTRIGSLKTMHCGSAQILSDVSGTITAYAVEISRVFPDSSGGRDLLLTVTDDALLSLTGGIVQGMSGSPILQDGCLVGAVTHVLVNDPTRGYGIGIERMLEAAA